MKDSTPELRNLLGELQNRTVSVFTSRRYQKILRDEYQEAINAYINKRELEARIDALEYAKISPKFKIEEKIEQLRLELKK